jgi:hypothetical protein
MHTGEYSTNQAGPLSRTSLFTNSYSCTKYEPRPRPPCRRAVPCALPCAVPPCRGLCRRAVPPSHRAQPCKGRKTERPKDERRNLVVSGARPFFPRAIHKFHENFQPREISGIRKTPKHTHILFKTMSGFILCTAVSDVLVSDVLSMYVLAGAGVAAKPLSTCAFHGPSSSLRISCNEVFNIIYMLKFVYLDRE